VERKKQGAHLTRDPQSAIRSPKSKVENRKSQKRRGQRLEGRKRQGAHSTHSPQSTIQNPQSKIENRKLKMLSGLTLLGQDVRLPVRKLETFPNQHPGRRYTVTLVCPEFTCVCPATGQPDYATITIKYIPDQRIVESKSLKLYLWSFRNEGHFHEHVTNIILDDLVKALDPISCEVEGRFSVRGGISITVQVRYDQNAKCKGA
jgi:7-cyano-7-deazaguanine reductase